MIKVKPMVKSLSSATTTALIPNDAPNIELIAATSPSWMPKLPGVIVTSLVSMSAAEKSMHVEKSKFMERKGKNVLSVLLRLKGFLSKDAAVLYVQNAKNDVKYSISFVKKTLQLLVPFFILGMTQF